MPYRHSHTYDILPAKPSGVYFADGVVVGSTLRSKLLQGSAPTLPFDGN